MHTIHCSGRRWGEGGCLTGGVCLGVYVQGDVWMVSAGGMSAQGVSAWGMSAQWGVWLGGVWPGGYLIGGVCPRGCLPEDVCPGGVCLGGCQPWGVCPEGLSAQKGCLPMGCAKGVYPSMHWTGGCLPQCMLGWTPPPLWTEFLWKHYLSVTTLRTVTMDLTSWGTLTTPGADIWLLLRHRQAGGAHTGTIFCLSILFVKWWNLMFFGSNSKKKHKPLDFPINSRFNLCVT